MASLFLELTIILHFIFKLVLLEFKIKVPIAVDLLSITIGFTCKPNMGL